MVKCILFFISPNTTLMLIMFPSFLHDETNEFESDVKNFFDTYLYNENIFDNFDEN